MLCRHQVAAPYNLKHERSNDTKIQSSPLLPQHLFCCGPDPVQVACSINQMVFMRTRRTPLSFLFLLYDQTSYRLKAWNVVSGLAHIIVLSDAQDAAPRAELWLGPLKLVVLHRKKCCVVFLYFIFPLQDMAPCTLA